MDEKQSVVISAPTLPKGGGAIQSIGKGWGAVGVTGAASLAIPLPISVGRGFAPQLNLGYSSGSGRSVFGQGWNLSLPVIARQSSKGIPDYEGTEPLFVGPDGDLLQIEPDKDGHTPPPRITDSCRNARLEAQYQVRRYVPRTVGDGVYYEHWQPVAESEGGARDDAHSFWLAHHPDGILHAYGRSVRIEHVRREAVWVAEWLLEESIASNGEHILYEYKAEDGAGLEALGPLLTGWSGRDASAQRYLTRVRYGNHEPDLSPFVLQAGLAEREWHFDLVFDYGERSTELEVEVTYDPPVGSNWRLRADPVSNYRYGFELRTLRLCHQVLMFHRFPELGEQPVLVQRLLLEFDESPVISYLSAAHMIGYGRGQPTYVPPMEFTYTAFALPAEDEELRFAAFLQDDPRPEPQRLPGINDGQRYQLVDLCGEGLPGVLSHTSDAWWYRRPIRDTAQGGDVVTYAPWARLEHTPAVGSGVPAYEALTDLNGDGKLEWVVARAGMAGFFTLAPSLNWGNFTPYAAIPPELLHPQAQLADLIGAGLSDLALMGTRSVRLYGNLRDKGFAAPITVAHEGDEPLPVRSDNRFEIVAFGDVLGSGQQHLIHIQHNEISCFPNLGRGRFGRRIKLATLPFVRDTFNTAHVLLADLDGSGAADLLYFQGRTVQVFMNQSGHGFASPVTLRLPSSLPYDATCELSTADLQGLGCSSLVLTTHRGLNALAPQHWRCDLNVGIKPYLLQASDNNMGVEGSLTYRSSAQEWLDEKQGHSDPTSAESHLPFPMHVVVAQTQTDQITGNRLTQSFQYRGGYYDGIEREFRGFRLLLQRDTETLASVNAPKPFEDDTLTAPVLTKTWFHIGDRLQPERDGLYTGDGVAEDHPLGPTLRSIPDAWSKDHIVPPGDPSWSDQSERDAARTLSGSPWRTEVFHGEDDPALATPYSVAETRYLVRQLASDSAERSYAIMHPLVLEQRQFQYERLAPQNDAPADPTCQHTVNLRWDRYGSLEHSVSIAYARRAGVVPPFPDTDEFKDFRTWWTDAQDSAQAAYYFTQAWAKAIHLNNMNDYWRLHLPWRGRSDAIIIERDKLSFSALSYEPLIDPNSILFQYQNDFTLVGQSQIFYTGYTTGGQAGFNGLVSFTENVELDARALQAYIPPPQDPPVWPAHSLLGATEIEIRNRLTAEGYLHIGLWNPLVDSVGQPSLWAVRRNFVTYANLTGFYRPRTERLTTRTGVTKVVYDPYFCLPIKVTLPDGCVITTEYDYRTFQPRQIVDPNLNVQQASYDGLGRLIASTFRGEEPDFDEDMPIEGPVKERTVGFPLFDDDFLPRYTLPSEAIADPRGALQEAAAAFFYDAFSWMGQVSLDAWPEAVNQRLAMPSGHLRASARKRLVNSDQAIMPEELRVQWLNTPRVPCHSAGLIFDRYPNDPLQQVRIVVSASDGFGRVLQSKQKVPAGLAYQVKDGKLELDAQNQPVKAHTDDRWRVSGRVEYNNKGLVVRVYQPYFANTFEHIDDASFRLFGYCDVQYYDAIGRPSHTLTPREEWVFETVQRNLVQKIQRIKRDKQDRRERIVKWYMKRWTYYPWYSVAEDENDTALEMAQKANPNTTDT